MSTIVARTPSRVLVLLTVIVAAILLLLASAVPARGSAPEVFEEYRVERGDSLWDVAAGIADPEADIRATVYEIQQINGLDGSVIHPGQILVIPSG